MREDFVRGNFSLRIEHSVLKLRDYNRFLAANSADIDAFKRRQQTAFEAERERWERSGQAHYAPELPDEASTSDAPFEVPHGCIAIASPVTGSVWAVPVRAGERVEIGHTLVVVEAMKMEIAIEADEAGVVRELLCAQGSPVKAGQALVILELED